MNTITLKGTPVEVVDRLPVIGELAPDIQGIDADWKERSLKEFKGQKKIICFVPSLDTAVCSLSAQKFNEKISHIPNTIVLYFSMDLPFVFKRVCEHLSHVTPLSLLRSPTAAKQYGSLQNSGPVKGLCARSVFVLDALDHILHHELVSELTSEPDYDRALSFL